MSRDLCAVVLAAGEGRRLRPLTLIRPKALCPVGNVPLVDRVLTAVEALGLAGPGDVAVNACWLADQVIGHVGDRAHVRVEPGHPLGTAGGVGNLRDWIAGRDVLVCNADAYHAGGSGPGGALASLVAGWDGDEVRLLGVPTEPTDPYRFGAHRFAGACLLPWRLVRDLPPEPAELVRTVWRPAERAGALTVVEFDGVYIDSGTPADYLRGNLDALDGRPCMVDSGAAVTGTLDRAVIGAGAVVRGPVTRGVVWPGGRVAADEHLRDAIRAGRDLTLPATPA